MIKYNSEKKEVTAKGTLYDITSEVLCLVGGNVQSVPRAESRSS